MYFGYPPRKLWTSLFSRKIVVHNWIFHQVSFKIEFCIITLLILFLLNNTCIKWSWCWFAISDWNCRGTSCGGGGRVFYLLRELQPLFASWPQFPCLPVILFLSNWLTGWPAVSWLVFQSVQLVGDQSVWWTDWLASFLCNCFFLFRIV